MVNPKIEYCNRLCTLCSKNDIQDELHVLMVCPHYTFLRKKSDNKENATISNYYMVILCVAKVVHHDLFLQA